MRPDMLARQRPENLPSFRRPPVNEVVLGVRFESPKLSPAFVGAFWQQVRARYPRVGDIHPAIDQIPEEFGHPLAGAPAASVRVLDKPEAPRCWFLDTNDNRLLQVQEDALFQNWRAISPEDYPRYEPLRESFEQELGELDRLGKREGIGGLVAHQAELSFVNVIPTDSDTDPGEVFSLWSPSKHSSLPPTENAAFQLTYALPGATGAPIGRLRITASPAVRKQDKKRAVRLELTARRAAGPSTDQVLAFLDFGHDWIVRAFAEVTTPAMHQVWERY
jgi:uncharacterized protein (TIGR04255 family)